jgi:hypothetical protein
VSAPDNGSAPGMYERLRRALRAGGLPLGEALHPVTLAASAVLVANDWLLKPRWGPNLVTGKLSDLAGLVLAPLVLTAAIGLVLVVVGRFGARVHPTLTHRRLVGAVVATGAVFAAIKLSERAASWFTGALGMFRHAAVVVDPTDLVCLPMLVVAYWIGRDELRRLAR